MPRLFRLAVIAGLSAVLFSLVASCIGPAGADTPQKQNITAYQPLGRSDSFELVFNDEFDGPVLDRDRWTTCYWWDKNGCTNLSSNELQWYMPDNISIENGALVLTARPESVVGFEGRRFAYTSGLITTGRYYAEDPSAVRFEATEGFFEIRAKLPSGQGLWPAFWMLPSSLESRPEIDIMEILGHAPGILELHYHYGRSDRNERSVGREVETTDLSQDWHVFGLDWTSERLVWYLDGEEVWRYAEPRHIPDEPMYLILNLAVGGNWPGNPDETTVFPAQMKVDYVRAWSRR
jgi:beta-glucanase (GH16 family)